MWRNIIIPIVIRIGTPRIRKFIADYLLPFKSFKEIKNISQVLYTVSLGIYESKKKLLAEGDEVVAAQVGQGKDIISVLSAILKPESSGHWTYSTSISLSEGERDGVGWREAVRRGNYWANDVRVSILQKIHYSDAGSLCICSSLTFAATDSTSAALCRTFHLLALHKDAQEKVRQEIRTARQGNNGKDLDYDMLISLPYLDAVCRETLRLWVDSQFFFFCTLFISCRYPPVSLMERTWVTSNAT